MNTTPRRITGSIKRFLATLESATSPVFLLYTAVHADYQPGYCLNNCEAESLRSGDAIVFGWLIWENRSQSFIEAEFHAVIQHGDELLDITPRRDGERSVLFVPDNIRRAHRMDARTWTTWSNHKSLHGAICEATRLIDIEDLNASVRKPALPLSAAE